MTRPRFPHPLTLLTGCVLAAALLSWVLPAGRYDRREDPATGRSVVVPGTYHAVEPSPVGPFDAVVDIPKGMADAADIIFLVFLIGGAFTVVDRTGALRTGVTWLSRRLRDREVWVIPVVSLFFATGGVLENMQEEIIALVPVLLILTGRLGFRPLVAISMSAGAAFVGSAFSPINPFQVGIAQKLAELPLLSGGLYRLLFLLLALAVWIGSTMRYAARTRRAPDAPDALEDGPEDPADRRHGLILGLVVATFGVLVYGLLGLGWGFDELSALFFIMGVVAGLMGGLRIGGTAEAYVAGFRSMAYAALLIGFARAIFVVLDQGQIVDTIVRGVFSPIEDLPLGLSALGMMAAHTAVHVPVPSVSGHAVLTMPVLVPLSDLLGLSRQVTVLAYQYGAGLCDLLTPTNGALLAILAAGGVGYEEWLSFAVPRYLVLLGLGMVAVLVAIGVGL
ncbi:MAG: YfcC family protein [Gemmatimonadota bacterium]